MSAAGTVYERNLLHGDPSLYSLSKRKQMSFSYWSRHEPVRAEQTDHWSKLRCKSYKLTKLPTGTYVSFCKPQESWVQAYARKKLGLPRTTVVTPSGTLAPVGSPDFNKYLIEKLHNPHLIKPRPPSDSRNYDGKVRAPSACSQRAKLGQKYWMDDSHKYLSHGQKVIMGSKGTYLGLGVPRL